VTVHCECGYLTDGQQDLTDHYREIFTPEDDKDPDGLVHAEAARDFPGNDEILACLCGCTGDLNALDEHFLQVFAPADRIGRDGRKHGTRAGHPAHPRSGGEQPPRCRPNR
jgi:hypothetical protein